MNVTILGTGPVGDALTKGFLKYGHTVMRGSRDLAKLDSWKDSCRIGSSAEAAAWGDMIVLAVKGSAAESVLEQAGHANLSGKVIIDTTNPIADAKPDQGVLRYFTNANESLMERLQAAVPAARFVKAFNSVGNAFMVDPPFQPKPTMFICGNDPAAKEDVTKLLEQFGWGVADMGEAAGARPIEALCQLWCIPGLRGGGWSHAFAWLSLG
jgi:predicted dinucleotide-binding enzyme